MNLNFSEVDAIELSGIISLESESFLDFSFVHGNDIVENISLFNCSLSIFVELGFGVFVFASGGVERVSDGGKLCLTFSESDLLFGLENREFFESILLVDKGLSEVFIFSENYNLVVGKSDTGINFVILGNLHLVEDRLAELNQDVEQVFLELGP